jgi:hypothetical protein
MQQRQLRLGDILDDYCPRERRITNHAVVAMVGEEIKQTRCTTCDSDHEYKHAKVPATRKKKDTMSAAFSEVLASVQQDAPIGVMRPAEPTQEKPTLRLDEPQVPDSSPVPPAETPARPAETLAPPAETLPPEPAPDSGAPQEPALRDEGPVHRRLIRATLPRTADTPATRPVPQFTMHEPTSRGGRFRSKGGHRPPQGGGAKPHGRPAGPKHHGGARKGGFGPHPRPARHPHGGAHAPRPGRKRSR